MPVDRIIIETRPPSEMRYSTLGDWFFEDGALFIQVASEISNPLEGAPFLVALHELIEAKLCLARGIDEQIVTDFDLSYAGEGEPGDAPDSPYRREHRFAMLIEHLVAHELGLTDYGAVE